MPQNKTITKEIEEILKELDGTDFEFIDLKIALKYKDVLWRDYNKIKVILQKSLKRIAEKVVGEMVVEEKEVGNQAYSRLKKIYGIRGWNELLKRIGYNQSCQDQIKKAKEMGIKI